MTESTSSGCFSAPKMIGPARSKASSGGSTPIIIGSETHRFNLERITIEPFNLRAVPRHSLVIDRLSHWYFVPREWLKKAAIMNDVYLMNNPFTFQAMEKHSAYCALMRLGLRVPETWLIPHKTPPENPRFS